MSHVTQCKYVLKNLPAIEAAAKRMNGELHRGQSHARMYASGFVDDSTTWREFFSPAEADAIARMPRDARVKVINQHMSNFAHVITFKGAAYDVGVVLMPDGTFRLRYDEYGQGGLASVMGPGGGRFMQLYGVEAAKRAARVKGYSTKETTREDGQIELELLAR